jgi:hypothetical protein
MLLLTLVHVEDSHARAARLALALRQALPLLWGAPAAAALEVAADDGERVEGLAAGGAALGKGGLG